MRTRLVRGGFAAIAALAIAGCGGGGSTGGVQSVPTPPPAPTPPPPPAPSGPPPIPAGPIGLQSNAPFATQAAYSSGDGFGGGSDAVQFSYSAADQSYTIAVPGHSPGQLVTTSGNGSSDKGVWLSLVSTNNNVSAQPVDRPVQVALDWPATYTLTYTSAGDWYEGGPFTANHGYFAYGIPTAAGDMPITGAASYTGNARGMTDSDIYVDGSVQLSFDFGAGTLSGEMKPVLWPWDGVPLGTYIFRDTDYSTGSTTFSGSFIVPNSNAPSSFSGNFNGPQAAEFMANWRAPYLDPSTGQSGMMAGIWTGKKN